MQRKVPPKYLWNLKTRVEAWNCLVKAAEVSSKYSLSPVVTTAYTYLSRYSRKYDDQPSELLPMCISAMFVAIKSEMTDVRLESLFPYFAKVIKEWKADRLKLFGMSTSLSLKQAIVQQDQYQAERLRSSVLSCELYLLTYNDWRFIDDYAFEPYIHWMKGIRRYFKEGDLIDKYREVRSVATNNMCVLIVAAEEEIPPSQLISAAAISAALTEYPLDDRFNGFNWIRTLKLEIPVDDDLISLTNSVPELRKSISDSLVVPNM